MFSTGERSKSKHRFGRMKVCETQKDRRFFTNPKIEKEAFG